MESLSIGEIKEMLIQAASAIVENEPLLTQADRQSGDGDHGVNMALGFSALKKALDTTTDMRSLKELFHLAGVTLVDSMGGASGVLFCTLFVGGIRAVGTRDNMTLNDFAVFFGAGAEAIRIRGKAKLGDRTMLDALIPAVEGLTYASKCGLKLRDGFGLAAEKAKDGMEKTKTMVAKAGRAKAFADQSIGWPDAGATSVYIIFDAFSRHLYKKR